jgi:hypothetical protein
LSRILGALIAISICSGAARGDDLLQLYKNAMETCLHSRVSSYDDGATSAILVAHVLVGICRREYQGFYTAAMNGRSDAYKGAINRATEEDFTGLVLLHRTGSLK